MLEPEVLWLTYCQRWTIRKQIKVVFSLLLWSEMWWFKEALMSMRYRCIIAQWDWGLGGPLDHHWPSRTGSCDNRNINRRIFLYFVDFRIFVCMCIYHLHIKSIFLLLLFVEVRNCYFLKLVVIWRCLETKYCYLAKYLWEMD